MTRVVVATTWLVVVALVAGCGSATTQSGAAATNPRETVPPAPTTTVFVDVATSAPPSETLAPAAADLLGLWRYVAVEGADEPQLDNLQLGFLRVEAPVGIGLSIGTFRAIDPTDFTCTGSAGTGGALAIDDATLRITEQYEAPAVLCPPDIGQVPIVDAVGACLLDGCRYELSDGRLRLSVSAAVTAVLERV